MKDKILCVDDDATIQALVEVSLPSYHVLPAYTIQEAHQLLKQHQFSSFVVDISLPDGDGLRLINEILLKDELKDIPVFIFSDHKEISHKVTAFSLGADDYIEKPFDPIEFKTRIESRIQKNKALLGNKQTIQIADVVIDLDRQKVFQLNDQKEVDLQLTANELKILKLFSKRLEQVYSREQILQNVWGETFVSDRTVDSHIAHLRQKISRTKLSVNTIKNFGYNLTVKN